MYKIIELYKNGEKRDTDFKNESKNKLSIKCDLLNNNFRHSNTDKYVIEENISK